MADGSRHGEGNASLCAVFKDEDFDPTQPAYYYLRVVENPSPRWSLLDCLKYDKSERPHHPGNGLHSVAGNPDNGAGVNVADGSRHGEGNASLCAKDEDFDPTQPGITTCAWWKIPARAGVCRTV